MDCDCNSGCTPDKCGGCTGCGGQAIEKITIKVEWKHKGPARENEDDIMKMMQALSGELMVSGVELVYVNNTFEENIPENSSEFFINGHQLSELVDLTSNEIVSQEQLRKGIFQVLLKNL